MGATFDELLKYIEKRHDLYSNQTPPILVHGGKRHAEDIRAQLRYNKQLILRANEFTRSEGAHAVETVKQQLQQNVVGDLVVVRQYEDLKDLEAVLDGFTNHFNVVLDKEKIIRRVNNSRREETFFYLFIIVIDSPFFET
jgi:hypothetical protein